MTDRLTAIKARMSYVAHTTLDEDSRPVSYSLPDQSVVMRRELLTVDLPWAVSRLEQLQQDVQRVLFMVDDDSADPLQTFRLLQAALDQSKEAGACPP